MSDDWMKPPRLEKIDWTKPLLRKHHGEVVYLTYHGATNDRLTPHLISAEIAPGNVFIDLVDDYGRDFRGDQIVVYAPEPRRVHSGAWMNIYSLAGAIFGGGVHASKKAADDEAKLGRIACIRLPDFAEGFGLDQ